LFDIVFWFIFAYGNDIEPFQGEKYQIGPLFDCCQIKGQKTVLEKDLLWVFRMCENEGAWLE